MGKPVKEFIKENYPLIIAIIYLLSPIDFLPDLVPALGFVDDLFVLVLSLIYRYYLFYKEKERLRNS